MRTKDCRKFLNNEDGGQVLEKFGEWSTRNEMMVGMGCKHEGNEAKYCIVQ